MKKLEEIKAILIANNGHKFYYKGKDMHTQYGFIKDEVLKKAKPGQKLRTNTDKELVFLKPSFIDKFGKIKHGAQTIPLKDIGIIISETGLESNWKVIDAGAGTGALCCSLAKLVSKVYAFEIREDHLNIVDHNIKLLGLKNIELKQHDIYEGLPKKFDKKINLITLDLPEPWKVVEHAAKALKPGGFLISYSPCIPQVSDFVEAVKTNDNFLFIRTLEIIEREWEVDKRRIRPKSQRIGHSGFISFVRKIT